jgi:hypothetical protein
MNTNNISIHLTTHIQERLERIKRGDWWERLSLTEKIEVIVEEKIDDLELEYDSNDDEDE